MAHEAFPPDNPFALGELSASLQTSHDDASDQHYQAYLAAQAPAAIWGHPYQNAGVNAVKQSSSSGDFGDDPPAEGSEPRPEPKKRKRNKPTLSCRECVEKKIKCDRGRPQLAEVFSFNTAVFRVSDGERNVSIDSKLNWSTTFLALDPSMQSSNLPCFRIADRQVYRYPFSNYWTLSGGLAEVICVLPRKEQADILVEVFFESVDPVYPLLNRERFYIDYEGFWALDNAEKAKVDADFLALIFIVLAMGTQFLKVPGSKTIVPQNETAEFYSSACHQSLRLFSYLNRTSIRAIQSMVFMTYFLLNSGRASDGWAFSGILVRQAYATGLNREPSLVSPQFTLFERLERRRLWHAIVCQDSFMSMSLRLPPAATHCDIDNAAPLRENDDSSFTEGSPESISEDPFNGPRASDQGYVQSMYSLALLAQETIATPRSLSLPMASNPRQRSLLLARFRATYRSFPDAFRAWDESRIATLVQQGEKRLVRQIMFLTGIYWHCITLIQSEGLEEASTEGRGNSDASSSSSSSSSNAAIRGTLEAAYEAMRAFFVIHSVLKGEGSVWWAFCHRAFSAAIIVANLVKRHDEEEASRQLQSTSTSSLGTGTDAAAAAAAAAAAVPRGSNARRSTAMDPLWERARADVLRMLEILKGPAQLGDEGAKTRVEVLSSYLGLGK
ncbi:hypothetical protein T310_7359 [Rasamsonia emersonii CBS 393.64]|uniref:Xylanolytic transcriptional activator regulatory domain-containing protein n=1 Tax=Rasamsonia emersonii (strain ATCC 16479 / CBS 393.64 / IMI 116815) TaxID=1408163 RepID=A0A0F4YKF9_RASE3|nr:hypothetical protein T310_7359 [Rasamsonia emersonii CBS 393.64]KKA18694.1 hypothetical protein T310_7359 [Rasamsonia emersonii CBS 393.64]